MGENVFEYCDNLLVTIERDSYAAEYCKENGVRYQYTDYKDWLLE